MSSEYLISFLYVNQINATTIVVICGIFAIDFIMDQQVRFISNFSGVKGALFLITGFKLRFL